MRARERTGASMLMPGCMKWRDAFEKFAHSMSESGSPTRAGDCFKAGLVRLKAAQHEGACFVNAYYGRKRSGFVETLTWQVAQHPITKSGYEGIVVLRYLVYLRRRGVINLSIGAPSAFINWHTLGRMAERSKVNLFDANSIIVGAGLAGIIMRESERHRGSEINLTVENLVCTGTLRSTLRKDGKPWGFFDVLTALPSEQGRHERKRRQGIAIGWAAHDYLKGDTADPKGFADKYNIEVIPFRETDYVSRELAGESKP